MRDLLLLSSAWMAVLVGPATAAPRALQPEAATRARVPEAYARRPLAFEENRGQAGPRVRFLSRGDGYTLLLDPTEAVLRLEKAEDAATVLRMKVLGANARSRIAGLSELPGRSNYLIGNEPAAWRVGVPQYAAVRYQGIYPGVDLLFHGSNQRELEYDFVIGPGADPGVVRLGFEGAAKLKLDPEGNLVLRTAGGDVMERAPLAYQDVDGTRRPVAARYEVKTRREIGFRVAAYDHTRPLIIDPVLAYSTYLGGGGSDRAFDVAVDGSGNAYVTGSTGSTNFPTRNPLQASLAGGLGTDAFVTKFSAAGSLVYSTYLGGAIAGDQARGIAVDASGSAYVAGQACSDDFPTVNPAQAVHAGGCDAFVAKLSPGGDALAYSTFLGGTAQERAGGIAIDGSGSAYVTGFTFSNNFPTLNPLQGTKPGGQDGFVAKLSPSGALVYSTYLGGGDLDDSTGIAVDGSGSAYVTGTTFSINFPTANALQGSRAGSFSNQDAFVAKLSPAGNSLVYSTYFGGSFNDAGAGIAVDGSGDAYVAGIAGSADFPIANAVQGVNAGGNDAFVAKLSPTGSSLVYSTFLGGTSTEFGRGVAVDAAGNAYVTGWTFSTNFPTVNAVQASNAGPYDVFVTKLSPTGNALVYSTYLGGSGDEFRSTGGNGIAVDTSGNTYVVGATVSTNFPTVNAIQASNAGSDDAFVSKIAADPPPRVDPIANAGPDQTVDEGTAVTLDGSASTDPNGDPLRYLWEQIGGPTVTLSDSTPARPGFTAPTVSSGGATLTFRLTVDDGANTSTPDTVNVTVKNVNQVPVADAGVDQVVREGSLVTLHGEDSFDRDSDPLGYQWTQTAGPAVSLSDPDVPQPTFAAPLVDPAGETLRFALLVSDGSGQSTDDVQVVVTNVNQVPIADAGPDQTIGEGSEVTLDGTASIDPDADALTYAWVQQSGPQVTLSDPGSAKPSFTAPAAGPGGEMLAFQLIVSDGAAASEPDGVTITVVRTNEPPACELAHASPSLLWPPNHKLVPVRIVGVADPEDHDVRITVTAVTQDEPVNGLGDGDTSPDAALHGNSILLRAERGGHGTGRVYKVAFTAEDASGAACTGSVAVCVPHDRRGADCLDEGQRYNSLLH